MRHRGIFTRRKLIEGLITSLASAALPSRARAQSGAVQNAIGLAMLRRDQSTLLPRTVLVRTALDSFGYVKLCKPGRKTRKPGGSVKRNLQSVDFSKDAGGFRARGVATSEAAARRE